MAYSAGVRIKTDYLVRGKKSSTRADGTSALYLQLIIDKEQRKLAIEEHWHPDLFDEHTCTCRSSPTAELPRHQDAQQAQDVTLICRNALAEATRIFTELRLRRQPVTMDGFLREFRLTLSKEDVLLYFEAKLDQRLEEHVITKETWESQRRTLRTLKRFAKRLPFSTLASKQVPKKLEAWLQRQEYAATTRWCVHKDLRTYLNLAKNEDSLWFPDPYANFSVARPERGNWKPLMKRDIQLLDAYYRSLDSTDVRRPVLRRWLFALASCGMRISDQRRIEHQWRMIDVLSFVPWKNRKSGRVLTVKLSRRAQELWDDAVQERDAEYPFVFTRVADQTANEHLHAIEQELGLSLPLHHHTARHSFATQFLDAGGQLHTLKELMNHRNIQSTMVYVRTTPAAHAQAAEQIDGIFGTRPPDQLPPRRLVPGRWAE